MQTPMPMVKCLLELPIVEVTWHDACTAGEWISTADAMAENPTEVKTVGRLLQTVKNKVTIVGSINSNGHVGETTVVPIRWVTKIRVLEKGHKPRSKRSAS